MDRGRRSVRVSPAFFADLDEQLPAQRGVTGTPSAHDFLVHDLIAAVEVFATAFDDLPPLDPDRIDVRLLIARGVLAPRFAVVGRLGADGAVELIGLEGDLGPTG